MDAEVIPFCRLSAMPDSRTLFRATAGMLMLAFVLAGTVTSTLKGRVASAGRLHATSMAPWGVGTRPAA